LKLRSPAVLTIIGVTATVVVALMVVITLLLTGGGKAVSDNAALIGALVALGGVFTTQIVNSALEAQRAQQARNTEQVQRERDREAEQAQRERELERVMNLGENRIDMRISRSAWFPRDLGFPHS
jgi:cation transport ATPase